MKEKPGQLDLTPREQEIYNLILAGMSLKEIAGKLGVSYKGVDFHRGNLYQKLGVQSMQELLVVHNSNTSSSPAILPVQMAAPEKPLVCNFNDNSFHNQTTIWQYKIVPSIFYTNKITAGESYIFSYSFTSNIDFNFLDFTLVDGTPEANFFGVLGPAQRPVTRAKANIEYKGSVTLLAVKTTSSSEPHGNLLFLEINADKDIQPILTFTQFEIVSVKS